MPQFFHLRGGTAIFHHQKHHAVKDQHDAHHQRGVEMGIHPIVQQKAQHGGGQAGHKDLAPQAEDGPLDISCRTGVFVVVPGKRPQLFPIQYHHSQNGAQLDHHTEHGKKFIAQVKLQKLFGQDHVSGAGNGQPLGDALDDTV